MTDQDSAAIRDNREASRFELHTEGAIALVEYRLDPAGIEFLHTSVPKELEGRGIGSRLAKTALESARVRGLAVTPTCSFFLEYLRHHPEYQELVEPSRRDQLGLAVAPEERQGS